MTAPIQDLNDARRDADLQRYRILIGLQDGTFTLKQVLQMACTKPGKSLRKITLIQVLGSAFDWPDYTCRKYVERAVALAGGSDKDIGRVNIAWLLNATTAGHRYQCLIDSLSGSRGEKPWPEYPWRWKPE